jgi:hypothetical protein
MVKHGALSLNTGRVCMGTWPVVSLHQRNAAEGKIGMIETYVTSSTAKMHATGSKTGVESASALNRSNVTRGTMTTMVSIMINLTDNALPKEDAIQEESKPFPTT